MTELHSSWSEDKSCGTEQCTTKLEMQYGNSVNIRYEQVLKTVVMMDSLDGEDRKGIRLEVVKLHIELVNEIIEQRPTERNLKQNRNIMLNTGYLQEYTSRRLSTTVRVTARFLDEYRQPQHRELRVTLPTLPRGLSNIDIRIWQYLVVRGQPSHPDASSVTSQRQTYLARNSSTASLASSASAYSHSSVGSHVSRPSVPTSARVRKSRHLGQVCP